MFLSFLCGNVHAEFKSSGECYQVLNDYANLTNKSVFLPNDLSGKCVINNEKHLPKIFQNSGFFYKEKNDFISIKKIPEKNHEKKVLNPFKPYNIRATILFLNETSLNNCGLTVGDVIAQTYNFDYSFNFFSLLGCPGLNSTKSFIFKGNISLLERWQYSHGKEEKKEKAIITSSTGAVTNEYEYYTSGLNILLEQNEFQNLSYTISYLSDNETKFLNSGLVLLGEPLTLKIVDDVEKVRKIFFIPIGKELVKETYQLYIRFEK